MRLVALISLLFLIAVSPASAHHQKRVLGTTSSNPTIPPTVQGPGLILPDSPLFILDKMKQQTKLMFTFASEQKAKTHAAVAGERLAELRLMLLKNNEDGVEAALDGIAESFQASAENITRANLSGKNVSQTAKTINDDIKEKQHILDVLEQEADSKLAARVRVASEDLLESKVTVEDALTEEELENEIKDDLDRKLYKEIENASQSVVAIKASIAELERQAEEAAANNQTKREAAIKNALEERNEVLVKTEQLLLEEEKNKRNEAYRLQSETAAQVEKTVQAARAAAEKYSSKSN
jgi:hypothetical protein